MTLTLLENSIAAALTPETPSAFSQMAEAENEFHTRILDARKKVAELDAMKSQMAVAAFAAKEKAILTVFSKHDPSILREQQTIERLYMELDAAKAAHEKAVTSRNEELAVVHADHDAHSAMMQAAWEQEYKIATKLQMLLEAALQLAAKESNDG